MTYNFYVCPIRAQILDPEELEDQDLRLRRVEADLNQLKVFHQLSE